MYLHEYQVKEILLKYGINSVPFKLVSSASQIKETIKELGLNEGVAKIQVYAGGRGKSGGVKIANDIESLEREAKSLFGMKFSNDQTSGEVLTVNKIILSPKVDISKEYYVACTIDRERAIPILILSKLGGMDIEEVARNNPEDLLRIPLLYYGKIRNYSLRECLSFMEWNRSVREQGEKLLKLLIKVFFDCDATLLEINPLILNSNNQLIVLDAKMTVDDNALYRQPLIRGMYDSSQENPQDSIAKEIGLSYVSLNGSIGCLVNGAGLAMSTLDILKHFQGNAANFLDVRGSANQEIVEKSIEIILSSSKVKVLFINIFGGIMDCSIVAKGLISVLSKNPKRKQFPTVLRLEGTNLEESKVLLKDADIDFHFCNSLEEGVLLAINLARND